jgi:hypothetical protein
MANLITEVFYLTRDNTAGLILKEDNTPVDLSSVTKIEVLDTQCTWSVDSVASPDAFDIGGVDGKVVLHFGGEPIPAGSYRCQVIVYDPTNINGVVWDEIKLIFRASCPVPEP